VDVPVTWEAVHGNDDHVGFICIITRVRHGANEANEASDLQSAG
jgi:hypothetical protein